MNNVDRTKLAIIGGLSFTLGVMLAIDYCRNRHIYKALAEQINAEKNGVDNTVNIQSLLDRISIKLMPDAYRKLYKTVLSKF